MNPFNEYRLWIIVGVGSMSIFLLAMVWRYYYSNRKRKEAQTDYGLVFLISGIGMWVMLSIFKLLAAPNPVEPMVLHTLSMINNGLLLSSIPFFEHSKFLGSNLSIRKNWTAISGVSALAVLVVIYFVKESITADILDWGFSTIIFTILGGILFRSFFERYLPSIGYLSLVVMGMTIFSQFIISFSKTPSAPPYPEISGDLQELGYLLGGISFAMMLVIWVALAFTWILDENDVFDDWDDDQKAKDYWKQYKGKLSDGVEVLKRSVGDGLSRMLFKKCIALFDVEGVPNQQSDEMQNLEAEIIAAAGRFSFLTRSYQKGEITENARLTEIAKIQGHVLNWFPHLQNAMRPQANDTPAPPAL